MDWFQHSTGSHDDPDISDAEDRFGDAGYNVFFKILELYGREFNSVNVEGFLSISLTFVRRKLRKSSTKVQQILNFYQERKRIFFKIEGDFIFIKIPKFLELSSNWTKRTFKKDGEPTEVLCSSSVVPTAKEKEEEKEKKRKKKSIKENSSPDGSVHPFLKYLLDKISESGNGFSDNKEKLIEFYEYRMRKPKKDQYKSERGIDGLLRDCKRCNDIYADIGECLDITMERNWLTPDPEYLRGKAKTIEQYEEENGEPF